MAGNATPTVVDLATRAQVGKPVADEDWLAAQERENAAAARSALLDELVAHRAQGERHQAMLAARKKAEKAKEAFEAETMEPLRDAYAAYTQGRAQLTSLLDDYWERWKTLTILCSEAGVSAPPELNKWSYLHLADMEALGKGIVEPHALHRQGGQS